MKRLTVFTLCLVLVSVVACRKTEAPAAGQPEAKPAAAAPAGAPPALAEAAKPAEPVKIEITDDLVKKYMEYQKQQFALAQQYADESRKNIESAKGDTAKLMNQFAIADKASKEFDEKLKATRRALGLGEAEFEAVKDAVQMVATGRALYNQMGGDAALAKMQAEQRAQVERLPVGQRAAAEAEMASFTKGLTDQRDGVEVRKKYGDQSADVLMKYADALAKQYWDGLQGLAGKK